MNTSTTLDEPSSSRTSPDDQILTDPLSSFPDDQSLTDIEIQSTADFFRELDEIGKMQGMFSPLGSEFPAVSLRIMHLITESRTVLTVISPSHPFQYLVMTFPHHKRSDEHMQNLAKYTARVEELRAAENVTPQQRLELLDMESWLMEESKLAKERREEADRQYEEIRRLYGHLFEHGQLEESDPQTPQPEPQTPVASSSRITL